MSYEIIYHADNASNEYNYLKDNILKAIIEKQTIYHCLSVDNTTIPSTRKLTYQAETEQDAIDYLEKNGGGLYRNVLHNFEYEVKASA